MANTLDTFQPVTTVEDTDLLHLKRGTGVNTDKKITGLNAKTSFIPEGTAILSTGEIGGTKVLTEQGDGSSAWAEPVDAPVEGTAILSTGEVGGSKFLREDGDNSSSWQDIPAFTSPLTTKGDLFTYDTGDTRLPVGTDDYALVADAAEATGLKWAPVSGGFTSFVDDETYGNYAIGLNALDSLTSGSGLDNICIGENAGTAITTSDTNIAIGTSSFATASSASADNILIGHQAGQNGTFSNGNGNIGVGKWTLRTVSSGDHNCALGTNSLNRISTGVGNTALGYNCGDDINQGNKNILIGYAAGNGYTTGDFSIAIGPVLLPSPTDDYQIAIGTGTYTVSQPIISGYMSASAAGTDMSAKALTITGSSPYFFEGTFLDAGDLILQGGRAATTGIGIGGDLILKGGDGGDTGTDGSVSVNSLYTLPAADGTDGQVMTTDGAGVIAFEDAGGGGFTSIVDDETNGNYAIGLNALDSITLASGLRNTAIGENALTALTTGDDCTAVGNEALPSNTAVGVTAFGSKAGFGADIRSYNTFIGFQAGYTHGGQRSVFVGYHAGYLATSATESCTFVGYQAGESGVSDNSTAVGDSALKAGGLSNVAIGYNAASTGANNCIAIGSNTLNAAGFNSHSVAIGVSALTAATGANSIGIGSLAASTLTTGGYGLFLGYNVQPDSATLDDQFKIGHAIAVPVINGFMGARTDVDYSAKDLTITGPSAWTSATAGQQDGGDLILQGGTAATTGIGVGGDLYLRGGTEGSTGTAGLILMDNLPTSDPSVTGALWNNAGVLTVS